MTFQHYPLLLGTALLAYSFGLRHAVDADHIAAIDNVTRKLMQEYRRPVGTGLYFSLGHSTIVVLASVAVAATATAFKDRFESLQIIGGVVGTLVSACFLLLIAIVNMVIFLGVYRTFKQVKAGGAYVESDLDVLQSQRGVLSSVFSPIFRMIGASWQMYPLGLLFALGFDTATEVGLLGISATEGSKSLSIWSILVFPALFTAGMALVDTTDGVLMLGTYGWAFVKPIRKLYYNMMITFVSVVVALVVGGIEALGLISNFLALNRHADAPVALADRERTVRHPRRHRHDELADVMDTSRPAQRADIGFREPALSPRPLGELCHRARMTLCERHARVDHVGNGEERFVTARLVQRHRQIGLERQDRFAVHRRPDPLHQGCVGRDQTRKACFVDGACGDDVRHGLGTNGVAQCDHILHQCDQAHRGQDFIALQPPRQAFAIPALIDLAEVAPDLFGQAEPVADPLSDLAMCRQDRPHDRGRLREPRFDRLLLGRRARGRSRAA
jgi:high-affinity nickel-transport protein